MISKEILTKAKELISNPDNWIKGSFAKNNKNIQVPTFDANACKFCMIGSVIKVFRMNGADKHETSQGTEFIDELWKSIPELLEKGSNPYSFNDKLETTHQDVINALDVLIGALE